MLAIVLGPATATDSGSRDQEVADAVIRAYGLEQAYWREPGAFPTWDAIYRHYRQGFSAAIAEQMTEFTLVNDGDMATWVPEQIHVADADEDFALAWFEVPEDFAGDASWGFAAYMVVRLRREDGRWIVYWATDSATPPP